MEQNSHTAIQAKIFDFALLELIYSKRDFFKPHWTLESWAKFLIWLTLNCGLSGDKESLEFFADSLGSSLTKRMRRVFFERKIEDLLLHLMADPSEQMVVIMPLTKGVVLQDSVVLQALDIVGLSDRVVLDRSSWGKHDSLIAIPWNPLDRDS